MSSTDLPPSKIEEVHDDDVAEESSGSEPEDTGPAAASTSTDATKKKKKKQKKKSKASKALAGVIDKVTGSEHVPQELVEHVFDQVKKENPEEAKELDEASIRKMLQAAKIMDVIDGKAGIYGKNRKDMGEHKVSLHSYDANPRSRCTRFCAQFWQTQPVPQRGCY